MKCVTKDLLQEKKKKLQRNKNPSIIPMRVEGPRYKAREEVERRSHHGPLSD